MSSKTIVLIFLDGLNGINYHRLMTPFVRLRAEEGVSIHFFQSYNELKTFDLTKVKAVVTSRRCTVTDHKAFKQFLVKNDIKLILDNDDFWKLPKDNDAHKYYRKIAGPDILNTIKIADEIWTPSKYLGDRMRKINPDVPIRLVPNTVYEKEEQWADIEKEPTDVVRFGYLGANGHMADVKSMGMTFEDYELYCTHLGGRVASEGHYDQYLNAKHQLWPKDIHQYASFYKKFDVSLAPLLGGSFNKSKSNLKVVEAAFTRTAIIASNVTPYKECIKHNKTGILCDNGDDWKKAVKEMTLERARELAHELYEDFKDKYNLSKINKERLKGLV